MNYVLVIQIISFFLSLSTFWDGNLFAPMLFLIVAPPTLSSLMYLLNDTISCIPESDPTPVYTIDNQPLVSGLVSQDILTSVRLHDHTEFIRLGIVPCHIQSF